MINHDVYRAPNSDKIVAVAISMPGHPEMPLDIVFEDYLVGVKKYRAGAMIQEAFPGLTATQREFLMTGMTAEQQRILFGEGDE